MVKIAHFLLFPASPRFSPLLPASPRFFPRFFPRFSPLLPASPRFSRNYEGQGFIWWILPLHAQLFFAVFEKSSENFRVCVFRARFRVFAFFAAMNHLRLLHAGVWYRA
jgi:hypothetical protein